MTPSMNTALTWWMERYQPELMKMTVGEYHAVVAESLEGGDAYAAARYLGERGWLPNQELVFALADVRAEPIDKTWPRIDESFENYNKRQAQTEI